MWKISSRRYSYWTARNDLPFQPYSNTRCSKITRRSSAIMLNFTANYRNKKNCRRITLIMITIMRWLVNLRMRHVRRCSRKSRLAQHLNILNESCRKSTSRFRSYSTLENALTNYTTITPPISPTRKDSHPSFTYSKLKSSTQTLFYDNWQPEECPKLCKRPASIKNGTNASKPQNTAPLWLCYSNKTWKHIFSLRIATTKPATCWAKST